MKNLYFVAMQVFGIKGPLLINQYIELDGPFYPEHAKLEYLKANPGLVLNDNKDMVLIIFWQDITEARDKHELQKRRDDKNKAKLEDIRNKAAAGGFGKGDTAVEAARNVLKDFYKESLDYEQKP